jgi:hypothetical protein
MPNLRVAGLTRPRTALVTTRPYSAPPQTISDVALIGGQMPMPGEVSLAHHGVLLLDELPEFKRHVLEVLRQPLEKRLTYMQSPASHRPGGVDGVGSTGEYGEVKPAGRWCEQLRVTRRSPYKDSALWLAGECCLRSMHLPRWCA